MSNRVPEGRDEEHRSDQPNDGGVIAPKTVALMLESDGPGGAEWLLLRLAEELRNRGHLIVPVGPKRGVGWLRQKFCDHGFEPRHFDLRRPVDWRCARDMTRMLQEANVDVIHSHEFTMAVYGTVASRRLRIPHIITLHGNQQMTDALRRRMALRWAFRQSKVVTAVSRVTARQIEHDLGLADGAIEVIQNGVPQVQGNSRKVRHELGLQDEKLRRARRAVSVRVLRLQGLGHDVVVGVGGGPSH